MANWRLATIIDDAQAIKVAAAYYSLPTEKRDDLDALSDVSGVSFDVASIVSRLQVAGVLGHDEPPAELETVMNAYCRSAARRIARER